MGVLVDLDGGEGGDGGSVRFFVNGLELWLRPIQERSGRACGAGGRAVLQKPETDNTARCREASWCISQG